MLYISYSQQQMFVNIDNNLNHRTCLKSSKKKHKSESDKDDI